MAEHWQSRCLDPSHSKWGDSCREVRAVAVSARDRSQRVGCFCGVLAPLRGRRVEEPKLASQQGLPSRSSFSDRIRSAFASLRDATAASFAGIYERRTVAQIFPRWNPLTSWMRQNRRLPEGRVAVCQRKIRLSQPLTCSRKSFIIQTSSIRLGCRWLRRSISGSQGQSQGQLSLKLDEAAARLISNLWSQGAKKCARFSCGSSFSPSTRLKSLTCHGASAADRRVDKAANP